MWNMWTNIQNKRHSEIIWMLVIVISRALSYPNYISLCPMLRWLHRWVKLDNVTIISKQADWKTDEGNVQSDLLFSPEIGFSWVCASNQPPASPPLCTIIEHSLGYQHTLQSDYKYYSNLFWVVLDVRTQLGLISNRN